MRDMHLSIGQLSRAFSLSNEAIRFYEAKGLLHPQRNPESGYRTFDHRDIQRIGIIKRMQNQGFSLSEIEGAFAPCGTAEMEKRYLEKLETLKRQARYQARLISFTEYVSHVLAQPSGAEARLVRAGRMYYRTFDSVSAFWRAALRGPVYQTLLTHMPLTSFSSFVPTTAVLSGERQLSRGLLISAADLALIGLAPPDGFSVTRGGCALKCTLRFEENKFGFDQLVKPFQEALIKKSLTPAELLYTRQVASFTSEEGAAVHVVDAYLPVEDQPDTERRQS